MVLHPAPLLLYCKTESSLQPVSDVEWAYRNWHVLRAYIPCRMCQRIIKVAFWNKTFQWRGCVHKFHVILFMESVERFKDVQMLSQNHYQSSKQATIDQQLQQHEPVTRSPVGSEGEMGTRVSQLERVLFDPNTICPGRSGSSPSRFASLDSWTLCTR